MDEGFEGRRVVVVDGSGGIGLKTAQDVIAHGGSVGASSSGPSTSRTASGPIAVC
jgi:NAD(P)-dependent dehydrogenase (short-subunit alcohol dehydrogenase family)